MKSGADLEPDATHRILNVGRTGSGKTTQIWTLPGKKFGYFFDPNSKRSLYVKGVGPCPELDFEEYYPDFSELDATLKGFNKGSKPDDKPSGKAREPTVYMQWVEDINKKVSEGFFATGEYQWLVMDSLTFLTRSIMARQLWINNRYGSIEELGDFRIVGSKLAEVFNSIATLPLNIYCTGHISTYQDEKTAKLETQLRLPGQARDILPLLFTDIFQASYNRDKGKGTYEVRTKPDTRGLEDIRTSIQGLDVVEDVTITDWNNPTDQGIGRLLRGKPIKK